MSAAPRVAYYQAWWFLPASSPTARKAKLRDLYHMALAAPDISAGLHRPRDVLGTARLPAGALAAVLARSLPPVTGSLL